MGALVLMACTPSQRVLLEQCVEHARQAKDAEVEVLKASLCAMGVGAYHRVNNDAERRAIDVLCGGIWERPVTADDLRDLRGLEILPDGS